MEKKSNTLNVLTHLIPTFFGGFIFPLIVFLFTKDKETKEHSKKSLNWQLSYFIYEIFISIPLIYSVYLLFETYPSTNTEKLPIFCFFVFLAATLSIIGLIFGIIATVKASKNELWKYPLTIPFIR